MCLRGWLQGQHRGPSFFLPCATHGSSQRVLITKRDGRGGELPFPLSPRPAANLTLQHLRSVLLQLRPKLDSWRFHPCIPGVSPVWVYHLSFTFLHEHNGHLIESRVYSFLTYSNDKKIQLMFLCFGGFIFLFFSNGVKKRQPCRKHEKAFQCYF